MKRRIYFADLTHTAQGISAATFPLGVSFVMSHAMKVFGADFDFGLFKFPETLEAAIRRDPPAMLCLSNYSWNLEFAYTLSRLAKAAHPELVVVFGGPNFPVVEDEKHAFLARRSAVDFYVELEGELGFVDLLGKLEAHGFSATRLRAQGQPIANCTYLSGDRVVSGPQARINDVNVVPSPYLTGILDQFFDLPLVPMFETTRGCPFSCTFCSDGLSIKSKVHRVDSARTRDELRYIADRVRHSDELIITDLNFGMYKEDVETARMIAEIQREYGWPVLFKASAGKNRPERVIETASMLNGSWVIGAAIQSHDDDVLKSIKRDNISSAAFQKFIEYGNSLSRDASTYTEIILGLPSDSKTRHFNSLRFGVQNKANCLRMYQAMLLAGTEMATRESRERFGLVTKFRTIPGCVGRYHLFGEEHPIAEIEEIIVGSNTMPFEDYLECRVMNLIVETFYNNGLFEEVFAAARALGVDVFDCLLSIKDHPERYSAKIREIVGDFIAETSHDLFDSREAAERFVLTPDVIERYIGGELGINELLVHKARLFVEMDEIAGLLLAAVKAGVERAGALTPGVSRYLDQLMRFVLAAKKDLAESDRVLVEEFTYDFGAIAEGAYAIDPRTVEESGPHRYTFFHDEEQKKHIAKQLGVYARTPIGFGRFLQRSNLKNMYRRFKPVAP